MGGASVRTGFTSRGIHAFSVWNLDSQKYMLGQLLLGSNPNSKLEVVSLLNSFNLASDQYHFNYINCPTKYNPKVYLSAVQTLSSYWLYDGQTGQTNGLPNMVPGQEKSGS